MQSLPMKSITVLAMVVLHLSLFSSQKTQHLDKRRYNSCANSSASNSSDEKHRRCQRNGQSILASIPLRYQSALAAGSLSKNLSKSIKTPRCGVKNGPLRYSVENRWKKKSFKWKLVQYYLPAYGVARIRAQIREAFNDWATHAPLTFQEVSENQKADFELAFVPRYYDPLGRFDGSGGTLAYAYFPPSGVIRFDAEEPWSDKYTGKGFNLRLVATHEIGHALGLEHSSYKTSIMYEQYQLMQPRQMLPQIDRYSIQALYGVKPPSKATLRTTTRTTPRRTLPPTTTRKLTTRKTSKLPATTKKPVTTVKTTTRKMPVTVPTRKQTTRQPMKKTTTTKITPRTTVKPTVKKTTTRAATTTRKWPSMTTQSRRPTTTERKRAVIIIEIPWFKGRKWLRQRMQEIINSMPY